MRGIPGATILGVAFEAETAEMALKGSNELVNLVLQENVRLRTGRAGAGGRRWPERAEGRVLAAATGP